MIFHLRSLAPPFGGQLQYIFHCKQGADGHPLQYVLAQGRHQTLWLCHMQVEARVHHGYQLLSQRHNRFEPALRQLANQFLLPGDVRAQR